MQVKFLAAGQLSGRSPVVKTACRFPSGNTNYWQHSNGNGSLHSTGGINKTYYIYLDESWYIYTGNRQSNNTIATPTCAGLHTHTDACNGQILTCTLPEHTHTDACKLNCGMEAHTHTNACNETSHKVKIITAKYEADLASYWPIVGDNGKTYTGQMWQSGNSSASNKIVFLQKMPGENNTLNTFSRTGTTVYWYYYLEVLPGTRKRDYDRLRKGKQSLCIRSR